MQRHEHELWVKNIEEIKIKQQVEFRQWTDTAFEWKCDFCVSPFYQVVQKHKLFEVAQ